MSAQQEEMPDLLYSDTERALTESLRSLLADRAGLDKTLSRTESAETYDDGLWHAVAVELGCAGLLIPERDGGAGASYREACSPPKRWAARWPRCRSSAAPWSPPPRC
jgi:alkylation response protein AidB-like acyl-CoA dehydrogenase